MYVMHIISYRTLLPESEGHMYGQTYSSQTTTYHGLHHAYYACCAAITITRLKTKIVKILKAIH